MTFREFMMSTTMLASPWLCSHVIPTGDPWRDGVPPHLQTARTTLANWFMGSR